MSRRKWFHALDHKPVALFVELWAHLLHGTHYEGARTDGVVLENKLPTVSARHIEHINDERSPPPNPQTLDLSDSGPYQPVG